MSSSKIISASPRDTENIARNLARTFSEINRREGGLFLPAETRSEDDGVADRRELRRGRATQPQAAKTASLPTRGFGRGSIGFKPQMLIALIGNLGSGKTVFVKGLAKGLGCRKKDVLSPTFVLMRQYKGKLTLNHFDLYRLTDISQLQQIGYEEYFWGEGITAIEWADRIEEALPSRYLRIEFKILDKNRRSLKFIPKGKEYEDYLRQFKGQAIKIP